LVSHFLAKLSRTGRPACTISEDALALLRAYEWPGNVRELENIIERAVILCGGGVVLPEHLPTELRPRKQEAPATTDIAGLSFRAAKGVFERDYVEALLRRHEGSVAAAAKAAGMSRAHFYELLKKHHIGVPGRGRGG
jgi:two-component system response regulator GlrR